MQGESAWRLHKIGASYRAHARNQVHEFSGGDVSSLSDLGYRCADLVTRMTHSEGQAVPVLPSGGGTASTLDETYLPYVQALQRNVANAALMADCSDNSTDARPTTGASDDSRAWSIAAGLASDGGGPRTGGDGRETDGEAGSGIGFVMTRD